MISNNTLNAIIEALPEDIRDSSGTILQSGASSLKKSDIYMLGFNPGSEGGSVSVLDTIKSLQTPGKEINEYLDGDWETDKFQSGVRYLIEALGYEVSDIPGTNLVFSQSRDIKSLKNIHAADQCWPVHEIFLDIIRPKMVLCIGNGETNSSYSYLCKKFNMRKKDELHLTKVKGWGLKRFKVEDNQHDFWVVGVPHFSRSYHPKNYQEDIYWIKDLLVN